MKMRNNGENIQKQKVIIYIKEDDRDSRRLMKWLGYNRIFDVEYKYPDSETIALSKYNREFRKFPILKTETVYKDKIGKEYDYILSGAVEIARYMFKNY